MALDSGAKAVAVPSLKKLRYKFWVMLWGNSKMLVISG